MCVRELTYLDVFACDAAVRPAVEVTGCEIETVASCLCFPPINSQSNEGPILCFHKSRYHCHHHQAFLAPHNILQGSSSDIRSGKETAAAAQIRHSLLVIVLLKLNCLTIQRSQEEHHRCPRLISHMLCELKVMHLP